MNGASEGYIKRGHSKLPTISEDWGRGSFYQKESKREQTRRRANERQGGVNSRFSDAAEPHLHRDTGFLVWGIPGAAQGRSILSRDERVRKSAMVETRVTKGRQRYTDCYLAIQVADIIGRPAARSCCSLETVRLLCGGFAIGVKEIAGMRCEGRSMTSNAMIAVWLMHG
jgi:hypothetical protein